MAEKLLRIEKNELSYKFKLSTEYNFLFIKRLNIIFGRNLQPEKSGLKQKKKKKHYYKNENYF